MDKVNIVTLHKDNYDQGVTPIPKNIFLKKGTDNVFKSKMEENHAMEQFFWTKDTVERLIGAMKYTYVEQTCCMFTPSLAHAWNEAGRDEVLLDIDKRFSYLPKFHYYDVRDPDDVDGDFRLLVLDPPFFVVPIEQIRDAVDKLTNHNYKTKLIIAFLTRAEWRLRTAFKEYNLLPTNFRLEYASIKPNKCKNFTCYSNIDLKGIKRKKETNGR